MIGEQLRRLRRERGLSLRALAAQAGVSATLLSQIERGVTDPSLSTVRTLASVFGESVTALFDDHRSDAAWVTSPGARTWLVGPAGSVGYERVTPGNGQLEVLKGVLAPGEATSEDLWSHPSTECAYVLVGELTVQVGATTYPLAAGQAITFDSRQPHRFRNASDSSVEFLLSVTPPNP